MAEVLKLSRPIVERPREEWASIAVELLGALSRIIQSERWSHHVMDKGVRALGYDKVHFEGESMGAMTGFIIGFRYPKLLGKMVLNTGFYLLKTRKTDFKLAPEVGRLGQLSQSAVFDPSYENIAARLHWLVAEPEAITDEMVRLRQRRYQDPEINASLRRVFNVGGTFDSSRVNFPYTEADCASWRLESLVLWVEHNPGHGPDFGENRADLIGAKFYNVKGAGHWPQWEKPDEYSQVMIDFLTR